MKTPYVEEPGALSESIDWWDVEYTALDEQLVCPICRTAFVEPLTTDCGHTFCRECLNESFKTSSTQDPVCPIDRSRLSSDAHAAPFVVKSLLDDLEVICPFSSRGCNFKGKRWLLDSHVLNDCEFVTVFCHPPCMNHIERRHFNADACMCNSELRKVHDKTASPISPDKSTLSDDVKDSHSPPIAECPGSEFGCSATEESHGNLSAHIETCLMAKLARRFEAQTKRICSLESENRTLKRQVDVFQHLVRRNAHELDSQILTEYDRLVRELRETESTLDGHQTTIVNLVAENSIMNAEVSRMKATIDNVHRQLFLLGQSQRRLSLHSSLVTAASTSDIQSPDIDKENEPNRRRSQQKL